MHRITPLLFIVVALVQANVLFAVSPDEARVAKEISQAEAAVKHAAAKRALWTTAEEALAKAKSLFSAGRINEASQPALLAKQLAELGLAQTDYPLFSE